MKVEALKLREAHWRAGTVMVSMSGFLLVFIQVKEVLGFD